MPGHHIDPERAAFDAFKALPRDAPIEMLNLLRFRGLPSETASDGDPWRGGKLPELPPPARRPPESVPKRFGSSGIRVGDEDLVEVLVRAYAAFSD